MAARRQPARPRGGAAAQADAGGHAHPRLPRPRPPHRRPRPAGLERARRCPTSSIRPPTGSPSGTSTASSSPAAWPARSGCASATCSACCATPTAARSASSTCTSRTPTSSAGSSRKVEGVKFQLASDDAAPPPRAAQRGRGVRAVPGHQVRRHEALRAGGRGVRHPDPRHRAVGRGRRRPRRRRSSAWPTAAGSTCSPTSSARATTRSSASSRATSTPTSVQGSGDVKYHLGADGQVRQPVRAPTSRWSWPPTPATSRPSTRSCSAWCGPARTRSTRPARTRGCRS